MKSRGSSGSCGCGNVRVSLLRVRVRVRVRVRLRVRVRAIRVERQHRLLAAEVAHASAEREDVRSRRWRQHGVLLAPWVTLAPPAALR